ncbi:hypothetical protein [Micromonospora globbae]|uniref:hypothetical protein n=1 Tax=Micromonospora globbae TaxID=1894969 RepID=UPI00386B8625|nr:hypothetical protein OH732_00095 [Micromonospora globbae]
MSEVVMSRPVPRGRRPARPVTGRLLALLAALVVALPLTSGVAHAVEPAVPYWVVPGEPGTESDLTLPGVADRVLGDSRRWPELFALNKGRTQPDGQALTDPAQPIRAGWVFVLPEGATSGEVRVGPPPTAAAQTGAPPAATPGPASPAVPSPPHTNRSVTVSLIGGGVLVALAVAVLLVVLLVRRRRTAGSSPPAAAPGSRAVLDRALRQLAGQSSGAQVYAALVGPDRVSLRLAPALPEAPPPWQARQQGAIWEAPSWQLDENPDGAGGLPLLATVGTVGGELAVVNLGRAPGIVALTGDRAASMRLAAAVIDEIGGHPAAADVVITVVGPPPAAESLPYRLRVTRDVRVVPAPVDATAPAALRDHLVVVTEPIPPAELERLGALAAVADGTAAVLVVGDAPNAAWRFEAGPDGALDVGILGLRLDRPAPRGRLVAGPRG